MRRHLRAFILILLMSAAIGAMVLGFANARTGDTEKPLVYNQNVVQLVPSPKNIILRQSQVGIRLKDGYEGRLIIDGRDIPDDQVYGAVTGDPQGGGNIGSSNLSDNIVRSNVLFTPGPKTDIERFSPGEHCIVAIFWQIVEGPDVNPQRQEWCFKVS